MEDKEMALAILLVLLCAFILVKVLERRIAQKIKRLQEQQGKEPVCPPEESNLGSHIDERV